MAKETYSEWTVRELKSIFEQGFITKGELKNALSIKKRYSKK